MREKDEPVREFEKQSYPEVSKDSAVLSSSGRRTLLAGMAASCTGVTASALAPKNPLVSSATAAPSNPQPAAVPCGRSKIVALDEATVVETSAGKIRGFKRNGVYILKGVPCSASTSGTRRFNLNFSGTSQESFKFNDPDGFLVRVNGPDYVGHVQPTPDMFARGHR